MINTRKLDLLSEYSESLLEKAGNNEAQRAAIRILITALELCGIDGSLEIQDDGGHSVIPISGGGWYLPFSLCSPDLWEHEDDAERMDSFISTLADAIEASVPGMLVRAEAYPRNLHVEVWLAPQAA